MEIVQNEGWYEKTATTQKIRVVRREGGQKKNSMKLQLLQKLQQFKWQRI